MSLCIDKTELFHVHTYRCQHAEDISDEAYVTKAIELGASGLLFSDHTPFPGDPFRNRMDYAQLPEYLDTLTVLKKKYADKIRIRIGLEVEYLPSYHNFYETLRCNPRLDFLMIGQHMYEISPGRYSFQLSPADKDAQEHVGCIEAMIQGVESGLFDAVAHPDRCFKRQTVWTEEMAHLSRELIRAACDAGAALEKNLESMCREYNYWDEFWCLVPEHAGVVVGTDAHSIAELVSKWDMQLLYYSEEIVNGHLARSI